MKPIFNRAPLTPNTLSPLPLGSIRPEDWLLAQLTAQRDGLTAGLDQRRADVGPECGWLGGPGDCGVAAPYYLDDKDNYTDTAGFDWHHIFPAAMRRMGKAWGWLWKMIPVVRLTIRPGTWTWFYLILAGWLCHKKRWRMILPILGLGLLWGICLLSPVNGCIRYYLPVYACAPVFLWWSVWEGRLKKS